MPTEQLEQQILTLSDNFLKLDFSSLEDQNIGISPWNGLDLSDYLAAVQSLKNNIALLKEAGVLSSIPWNIMSSLHGTLNNAFTHSRSFINSKNQQQFHHAFQEVEGMRTNLQTWGINELYFLSKEYEQKSQLLDNEIQRFLNYNQEVESIKHNVHQLIEPAVAGSLSKSFDNRKGDLHTNQKRWFWASVTTASIALISTYFVVFSIIGVFNSEAVISFIKDSTIGSGLLWLSVLLRIGLLLPIYSLFGLSFAQYRKERILEEEYAHKAAVATSLPNYGDLAVDNQVKDQILSEASKVIFTSPSNEKKEPSDDQIVGLEQLNRLMVSINKLVPKAKE
jgi:hypothetical protein